MKKWSFLFIIFLLSLCLLISCDTREDSFVAGNCYLESGNKIILYYNGYYNNVDFELYHHDPMTGKKTRFLEVPLIDYEHENFSFPQMCIILFLQ